MLPVNGAQALRGCQNLFIPAEVENHSLKSHCLPGCLYQLRQDLGIKASNNVGRDAFYKKSFCWCWVSPRRTGVLSAFLNARRDLKLELPKSFFSRNALRNDSSPPTSRLCFYPFGVLVVGGGSCKKCQGNPAWLEA